MNATENTTEPLLLGDGAEVRTGLYIRPKGGMSLLKISTPDPPSGTTVQVCRDGRCYPGRTTVRRLAASQLGGYEVATDAMVDEYHAWLDRGGR